MHANQILINNNLSSTTPQTGSIPSGTIVFRFISIPPEEYNSEYVSPKGGSLKSDGISGNYYNLKLKGAFSEVKPTGNVIIEISKSDSDVICYDATKLPPTFYDKFYQDKDLITGKHEFSQEYSKNWYTGEVFPTIFKSRRDNSINLILNPLTQPFQVIQTGQLCLTGSYSSFEECCGINPQLEEIRKVFCNPNDSNQCDILNNFMVIPVLVAPY